MSKNRPTIDLRMIQCDSSEPKKIRFELNGTKHYEDGSYELEDNGFTTVGDVHEFGAIVSVQFNQLKGKLFNLVEATIQDAKQQEAFKGLVRDFCNTNFKNVIGDLSGWIRRMGFKQVSRPGIEVPESSLN